MQLRIPRPLNGWRQFGGEVGIIVVGVLLALAAQEFVEDRRWRSQVTEARVSLDSQLAESMFASQERIALHACMAKKLDFLDQVIAGERPATNLEIRLGALRLWGTSAWDSATASGAVAHMPADIRNTYANLFGFTAAVREINRREFETVNDLSTLERHPVLTDISRDRLARDVATLRALSAILKLGGEQWLDNAKPLGLKLSEADAADAKAAMEELKTCVLPDGSRVPSAGTAAPRP
jgi:hypothetical protein